MFNRITVIISVVGVLTFFASVTPTYGGCGCDKPPPPVASVRPAFASPGSTVTLFAPGIRDGVTYLVRFVDQSDGWPGEEEWIFSAATTRRDFADGVEKPQLVVEAPELPPGPTSITVSWGFSPILTVPAEDFTMLQRPLVLPESDGTTVATCYRAAVGEDSTVYIPLDISSISEHMIFSGLGMHYPLLFAAEDIAIYNTQGVLMQLLGPEQADIYAIQDPLGQPHSFELRYDRHEFNTYQQQHAHEDGYGLDPSDPVWHTDGTRHIDHDHLVIAIQGIVENEGLPAPGVTPTFKLDIATALAEDANSPVSNTMIKWSDECPGMSSTPSNGGGNSNSSNAGDNGHPYYGGHPHYGGYPHPPFGW